jgi:UDP-2,3-diacylglucosamine pyrophosphatase LpxH
VEEGGRDTMGRYKDDNVYCFDLQTDEATFVMTGDWHIGAQGSFFEKAMDKIAKAFPNAYYLFLGDFVDFALKNSVGDVYSARINPQEQLTIVASVFSKYKDRILGVVQGNHDARIGKEVGLDPIRQICDMFGIPYGSSYLVVDVNFKLPSRTRQRNNITFALHHGVAGGRSKTASVRQGEYFERFITAGVDVYVTGHTHRPTITPFSHRVYDRVAKKVRYEEGYLITVSSMLDDEEYALRKMLEPTSFKLPIVKVRYTGGSREVEAMLVDLPE